MSKASLGEGKTCSKASKTKALYIQVSFSPIDSCLVETLTAVKNGLLVSLAKSPFSGSIEGSCFASCCLCWIKSVADAAAVPGTGTAPLGSICREELTASSLRNITARSLISVFGAPAAEKSLGKDASLF